MIRRRIFKGILPVIYDYRKLVHSYDFDIFDSNDVIPTIIPNWDNSPRSGRRGWVFHRSTPGDFAYHFEKAIKFVLKRDNPDTKIILIKSWNEWAEGNYLEPDQRFGLQYLEAMKKVIDKNQIDTVY